MTVQDGDPIPGEEHWVEPVPPSTETDPFGPGTKGTDWGRLRSGGPGNAPEDGFALFSNGSKFDQALAKEWGVTFDVVKEINEILRTEGNPGTHWNEGGDGDAVHTSFELGEGERITFKWTYDSHNSGNDVEQDAAFCILLDENGAVVWKGLIAQFDPRDGHSVLSSDEPFSVPPAGYEPALPAGKYTLIIGQIEEGDNNGQKPVLTIEDINKVTDIPGKDGYWEQDEDTPTYFIHESGNVIVDPNGVGGDGHMSGTDHMVNPDGTASPLSDAAYVSLWTFVDPFSGETIRVEFSGLQDEPFTHTNGYSITFYPDGRYEFYAESEVTPPAAGDFNIQYTVNDGEYSDDAMLYLRSDAQMFTDENAMDSVIHGSGGNDVIYGGAESLEILAGDGDDVIYAGSGGNLIYGGTGSDTMYSGEGSDTFAWSSGDLDGSKDVIMDFKLGQDVLHFDDLFGTVNEQVSALLRGGNLALNPNVDNSLLLTLGENYGNQQIEINLTNGLDQTMVDALNNNDTGAQAFILEQLLSN